MDRFDIKMTRTGFSKLKDKIDTLEERILELETFVLNLSDKLRAAQRRIIDNTILSDGDIPTQEYEKDNENKGERSEVTDISKEDSPIEVPYSYGYWPF